MIMGIVEAVVATPDYASAWRLKVNPDSSPGAAPFSARSNRRSEAGTRDMGSPAELSSVNSRDASATRPPRRQGRMWRKNPPSPTRRRVCPSGGRWEGASVVLNRRRACTWTPDDPGLARPPAGRAGHSEGGPGGSGDLRTSAMSSSHPRSPQAARPSLGYLICKASRKRAESGWWNPPSCV